jgi:thymidylate synthase (FAD)|tara:strand:+ start:639 stop:1286 length:648 start_codon:yes stop_codon:yes gene_type:complete
MQVKLLNITPNAEEHIVEIARVSSSRKDKKSKSAGLLRYLVKHKHWSPFEHSHATFEIETSKAIGIQLIRHRSFSFQEFSQRYQDVNKLESMFENIELRSQCEDNRQSSTEIINPNITYGGLEAEASTQIEKHLEVVHELYNNLLEAGVAREQARMILPLTTTTKIQMTGSIRSWIHFLELRDDGHAQKEIQTIAKSIKKQLKEHLPIITEALDF